MVSFASDTVQGTQDHSIYILLTRSGTWFSRLIHLVTSDCYTHASIGLDGPSGPFYSFARRYEHFALPAGLVEERPGVRNRQIPCCLYELKVSDPEEPLFLLPVCGHAAGGVRRGGALEKS